MTRRRPMRSASAQAAFIAICVAAAIAVAGIAVGMLTGSIPPTVAVASSITTALWAWALVRLLDIAAAMNPISLDCHDGRHLACPGCPCSCHQEP